MHQLGTQRPVGGWEEGASERHDRKARWPTLVKVIQARHDVERLDAKHTHDIRSDVYRGVQMKDSEMLHRKKQGAQRRFRRKAITFLFMSRFSF